jgi:DNA primase
MAIDPQISEICRKIKITDYLAKRGVELIRRGNRFCCCCPMPGHDDHSPSCYIRVMPDGAEVFKCFGCGESGNIITLIAALENESKSKVVKKSLLKRVSSSQS